MSARDLETIYEDLILEHYNAPYHRGNLVSATHTQTQRNPTCGDQVTLQLQIDERSVVTTAHHQAKGCVITQAATSILCEHIEGKSASELSNISPQDMLTLMQVPLTATRRQCALLPYHALLSMINTNE